MRRLIKKAHESLDKIEEILDSVNKKSDDDAWLDEVMRHDWVMYKINEANQIAVMPTSWRNQ